MKSYGKYLLVYGMLLFFLFVTNNESAKVQYCMQFVCHELFYVCGT